jgi:imidazole glycerol-phosphate synthase subunit HisH
MITIVDSVGSNIASIKFMLERLGVKAELSCDAKTIKNSSHVILPGVGSAAMAMTYLRKYQLLDTLCSLTQPVLGICLGMQLYFDFSEEDDIDCLGLIPGRIKKIPKKEGLSIPHMGWNSLQIIKENPLLNNIADNSYVYFTHSYIAPVAAYTLAITSYGEEFSAVIQYKNYFGTQFHPERSGAVGMMILKNFLEL